MKNYYSILGVGRSAPTDEIRRRFHELARLKHPDRFRGEAKQAAEAEFQSITEAFNVLRNESRRRQHDQELSQTPVERRPQEPERMVQAYLQRGVKAFREGQWTVAADAFSRATGVDPTNAKAWHYMALACSRDPRRLSRAMSAIQKACELEPMNAAFLKMAGQLFAGRGLTRRALRFYNQALQWGGPDEAIEEAIARLQSLDGG